MQPLEATSERLPRAALNDFKEYKSEKNSLHHEEGIKGEHISWAFVYLKELFLTHTHTLPVSGQAEGSPEPLQEVRIDFSGVER